MSLKRKRSAQEPEADNLALLKGLLQGQIALQVKHAQGRVTIECGAIAVEAPDHLVQRCKLLHEAPEGELSDAAETFLCWLKHEWAQDFESLGSPVKHVTEAHATKVIEVLKASNYLRDEAGLAAYSSRVYKWLLDLPIAYELDWLPLLHHTDQRCSFLLRLLGDLPDDLARRVFEHGPLKVLDRLPIDSQLARLVCDVYNDTARLKSDRRTDSGQIDVAKWSATPERRWMWRSAVAEHAGATLCVAAHLADWRNIAGSYHGLRVCVLVVTQYEGQCFDYELPEGLVHLELYSNCLTRGWRRLRLPPQLQSLRIQLDTKQLPARLSLAHLKLPDTLSWLRLDADGVDVSGTAFPPQLKSLFVHQKGVQAVDWTSVRLPASLTRLVLEAHGVSLNVHELQLPVCLEELNLKVKDLSLESTRSLDLPSTVRHLSIAAQDIAPGAWVGANLPEGIKWLGLGGEQMPKSGLRIPPGVEKLVLHSMSLQDCEPQGWPPDALPHGLEGLLLHTVSFGTSRWLRASLPPSLQELAIQHGDLGAESLEAVAWPASLTTLSIKQMPSASALVPSAFPAGLQSLELSHIRVSLKGAAIPAALTSLDLTATTLDDDSLSDITWPVSSCLQRLVLDDSNFGCATHVRDLARLPESITVLSLRGTKLGRSPSEVIRLPQGLRELWLCRVSFGMSGVQSLELPPGLVKLSTAQAEVGSCGYEGVVLPEALEVLCLQFYKMHDHLHVPPFPWPGKLRVVILQSCSMELLQHMCNQLRELSSLECVVVQSGLVNIPAGIKKWLPSGVQVMVYNDCNPRPFSFPAYGAHVDAKEEFLALPEV